MKDDYKYSKALLLVLILGLCCQGFAMQDLKMSYDISQVSDNYYVPAGGVYVAPEQIFVLVNGKLKQINVLCSDAKGVFVPYEEMSREFVRCPFCGGWYDSEDLDSHDCDGFPRE